VNTLKSMLAVIVALTVATGCATSGNPVPTDTTAVAFGSFKLIQNGHEARIGGDPLERGAYILVRHNDTNSTYVGRIGPSGGFAMALPTGSYLMEKFVFDYRGESIESPTAFRFDVPDTTSVYLGAIQLEATLESGLYGVVGTADRYTVSDRCEQTCAAQLRELDLPAATESSLMQWDHQVASLDR
jgi:hypothetical protein